MKPLNRVERNKCRPKPEYPIGLESWAASIPVNERVDAQPALAPSLAYNDVAIGLMSISKARYIAKVVIKIPAAICPGPIAEIKADSTNIKMGMSTVRLPTRATTFLENKSRVPFCEAIPNMKVTPTSVTNIDELKPAVICEAFMPPTVPSTKAAPSAKKPRLIFLMKPIATTIARTRSDIIGKYSCNMIKFSSCKKIFRA